jgi:hypothetical protein
MFESVSSYVGYTMMCHDRKIRRLKYYFMAKVGSTITFRHTLVPFNDTGLKNEEYSEYCRDHACAEYIQY